MSNKRPDELPEVSGLSNGDILIAEVNPSDVSTRSVVKISKFNLLSGVSGSGGTSVSSGISFNTALTSGVSSQIISYPKTLDVVPHVAATLVNTGYGGVMPFDISGVTASQYTINFSAEIPDHSYSVNTLIGGGSVLLSGRWQTGVNGSINVTGTPVAIDTITPMPSGSLSVSGAVYAERLFITGADGSWQPVSTGSFDGSGIGGATNIGGGEGLVSGVLDDDIKVKSLIAGTNVTFSSDSDSVTINSAGGAGGAGGSNFAFFSDAINNGGIIEKTYFSTPVSDTYLSGVSVDSASDITLYLRWDGPGDEYMGSASINGQSIPTGNITELGSFTRRFQGYIENLDLAGTTFATGIANGFTGVISVQEAGAGPTPFSVFMPPVSSGTPKAGTNLGSSDYKGGDTTTGYVTFDTSDVTGIKVFDHGVSDEINFTSYSLVDTGDGRHTAEIPITIDSSRNGSQTLKVVAENNFGTSGTPTESNAVTLDQTYPSISATSPSNSDYVNNQGLNSGESITFVNSISNWDSANGDTVLYSGLSDEILITDSGVFQNPKTVAYVTGIFNSSPNITISAARDDNGATDSQNVTIKIAKPPVITGISLSSTASSATSPNIVGATEIKGGDTVNAEVYVNGNGVSAGNVTLSVSNAGVSNGTQTAYNSYSSSTLGDGSFKYTVGVNVTSSVARDGARSVTVTPRNNFSTVGTSFTSAASATVNNAEFPSLTAGPVSYPSNQAALKDVEAATVTNTASTYDTIAYTSPGSELTISNSTTFEGSKNVTRNGGTYNITTDNFTVTATKNSNGMVRDDSTVVNIANTPAAFTINGLESNIQIQTGQAVSEDFDLNINQILYEIPELYLDYTQIPQSTLTALAQGTGTTSNDYRITVDPADAKGTFTFSGSGLNLAGQQTFVIGTRPNYIISGIVENSGIISNSSPCAGLTFLGGPMIDPSSMLVENVSKAGGGGANGGTDYTYQAYANGTSVDCTTDIVNKFAIVTSGAGAGIGVLTANTTGDFLFNLDMTQRLANTSAPGALFVISQP